VVSRESRDNRMLLAEKKGRGIAAQIDGADDLVFSARAFRGHHDARDHSDQPQHPLKIRYVEMLVQPYQNVSRETFWYD
jgi:hypothetical protein